MSDIQKKIKAVRLLRGFTQSKVAERAHIHVKTYQRMEAGTSPVTEAVLDTLAVIFDCTAEDIRRFNVEINQFDTPAPISPEEERLKTENLRLKTENDHLKRLLDKALEDHPDLLKKLGGGGEN